MMRDEKISTDMAFVADEYTREREFWLNKLSGSLVKSSFPYDHKKRTLKRNSDNDNDPINGAFTFSFSKEMNSRVIRAMNKSDSRLLMILMTGLVALLNKYTGNHDIVVGTSIDRQEIEGTFINTILPLRHKLDHNTTFRELLLQVRDTLIEAGENQNYPIETIPNELDMPVPVADDGFPLFDVAILLENIQDKRYFRHIKFSMLFHFSRTGEQVDGAVEYDPLLYEELTIERIITHYQRLLQQALFDIDKKIPAVEIMSENEKGELLVEFNDTGADYPRDKTICELFQQQVEKTPDGTAVIERDGERRLSYRQLNEKANQLSYRLRERGITVNRTAALMGVRKSEILIGILSILKSGGIYLPIDALNPDERIGFILEDSQAHAVLTQQHVIDKRKHLMRYFTAGNIIAIDIEESYTGNVSNPAPAAGPGDIAYMIYTSGTTGQSKGAVIEHRSLVNYIWWAARQYVKNEPLDFPFYTSISFDLTITSIFTPLITGNAVVVYGGREKDFLIEKIIDDDRAGIIKITPSHLKLIRDKMVSPRCIKRFIVGGEEFETGLAEDIYNHFDNNVEIYNEYGPTEATVGCMIYRFDPGKKYGSTVPIGVPAANTQIYLLDVNQHPVPPGAVGEIYIAGDGIARGYAGRPTLTGEKFLPNPFIEEKRMYRAGDLARRLPDGNLEFLGRTDHQVKIRGFRIELGEIETRLQAQHEEIKEAVVVAKEDKRGDKYLCAYIVSNKAQGADSPGQELDVSQLRAYLLNVLPDYMVPQYFVKIDGIPLTPNGKLDKKALPEPRLDLQTVYTPPRNEIEEKLVEMWAESLDIKREKIGIDTNYFELGGHSLKATVFVSQVYKEFGVRVPLVDIFKQPTIRELSQYFESAVKERFIPIAPVEESDFYSLSSAQKRLYILQEMEENSTAYNMPVVTVLEGALHFNKMELSFRKLVKRHEGFRTLFKIMDTEPVQVVKKKVPFKIDYREAGEKEVKNFIREFIKPFDLSQPPLLRALCIKVEEEKHIFMMDMHHIISDGISMNIFIEEFMVLYGGEELPLSKLQYKDYAGWQSSRKEKEIIKKQEEYWLKQFEEEISVLTLPTDYPRPPVQSFEGRTLSSRIGMEETALLNRAALKEGVTLYMLVLAIYNVFIYWLSGQEDVVIGSAIAGRRHPDLAQVIGVFINTLAIRNYPEGDKTFRDFLGEVKNTTLAAFENQEYQFEDLVDKVEVQRDVSRNPIFDVAFLFNNVEVQSTVTAETEKSGLKLCHYPNELQTTTVDLSIFMVEEKGELFVTFEYCTKLFKEETIQRFVRYFKHLVTSVLDDIDQRISEIDIVFPEERKQVLYGFNNNEAYFSSDKTIFQLFENHADMAPERIAVLFEDTGLTYRELNERANQLALYLRGRGVGEDKLVGILMERSPLMLESILAVWKAGGAYIPIDLQSPPQRVFSILNDSGAKVLFTQSIFVDPQLEGNYPGTVIQLDKQYHEVHKEAVNHANLDSDIDMNTLAYVIYTSGSTGKPKGVMVEHIGMMNHIQAKINDLQMTEKSIVAQNASHTFDISVWQFFTALTRGGRTVIYTNEVILNPTQFIKQLIEDRVSVLEVVPSYLSVILDTISAMDKVPALFLNYLLVTGEEVKPHLVKRWFEGYQGIKMMNAYGPTEASDDITHYMMDQAPLVERIPIGKPLQNLNIYIVNKTMKLCPIGVKGEICVSGVGVGRGYLKDEERTKQVFMEDPFVKEEGRRLYKTGDLGRWLPDGNIEFFGRKDYQVKIRGYRIELGEIESQLLSVTGVKEAVVIDREETQGNKNLYAYIVSNRRLDIPAVKKRLSKNLPDYMMPAYFLQIDRLPLTANGKINRKALPAPEIKDISEMPYITREMLTEAYANRENKEIKEKIARDGIIQEIKISQEEKKKILEAFNKTETEYRRDMTVYRLFQEQVHRTPFNLALVYEDRKITYEALNRKVNRMASVLRSRGVKRESIVGVMVARSIEMMVGLLGILKAGGAYLPIDDELPEERMKYMIKDSGLEVVLTDNRDSSEKTSTAALLIDLEEVENNIEEHSPDDPTAASTPGNLAYIMYTSGSTGNPKGVMIENRPLVNFIKGITDIISFKENDRILSLITLSFDIFFLEAILPLTKGSGVVIGSRKEQMDTRVSALAIKREDITVFQATPSMLQLFITDREAADSLKSLRYLLVGGELFPQALLERLRKKTDGRIYNLYGPTETTIWSTAKDVTGDRALNIGKPIANTRIYILGKRDGIQPIGAAGELCIGGDGVARGYLKREKLTSEKFTFDPFKKGELIYRTGDLARWLPDGNIEFLGRMDHQVQIKGIRVEPGEIESHILNYHDVKTTAVVARRANEISTDAASEDIVLCAFIVSQKALSKSELQEYLSEKLPFYMIPTYFLQLEEMPLLTNGKVNRKLLEIVDIKSHTRKEYVPPKTEMEKNLVNFWQEVLNLDKVGIHDNFFDVGGNSLHIIRVNSKIKMKIGLDIPVVKMFRYPTIHSLLKYLSLEEKGATISNERIDESVDLMEETMQMFMEAVDG